jgi:hypothetical protein
MTLNHFGDGNAPDDQGLVLGKSDNAVEQNEQSELLRTKSQIDALRLPAVHDAHEDERFGLMSPNEQIAQLQSIIAMLLEKNERFRQQLVAKMDS